MAGARWGAFKFASSRSPSLLWHQDENCGNSGRSWEESRAAGLYFSKRSLNVEMSKGHGSEHWATGRECGWRLLRARLGLSCSSAHIGNKRTDPSYLIRIRVFLVSYKL